MEEFRDRRTPELQYFPIIIAKSPSSKFLIVIFYSSTFEC